MAKLIESKLNTDDVNRNEIMQRREVISSDQLFAFMESIRTRCVNGNLGTKGDYDEINGEFKDTLGNRAKVTHCIYKDKKDFTSDLVVLNIDESITMDQKITIHTGLDWDNSENYINAHIYIKDQIVNVTRSPFTNFVIYKAPEGKNTLSCKLNYVRPILHQDFILDVTGVNLGIHNDAEKLKHAIINLDHFPIILSRAYEIASKLFTENKPNSA